MDVFNTFVTTSEEDRPGVLSQGQSNALLAYAVGADASEDGVCKTLLGDSDYTECFGKLPDFDSLVQIVSSKRDSDMNCFKLECDLIKAIEPLAGNPMAPYGPEAPAYMGSAFGQYLRSTYAAQFKKYPSLDPAVFEDVFTMAAMSAIEEEDDEEDGSDGRKLDSDASPFVALIDGASANITKDILASGVPGCASLPSYDYSTDLLAFYRILVQADTALDVTNALHAQSCETQVGWSDIASSVQKCAADNSALSDTSLQAAVHELAHHQCSTKNFDEITQKFKDSASGIVDALGACSNSDLTAEALEGLPDSLKDFVLANKDMFSKGPTRRLSEAIPKSKEASSGKVFNIGMFKTGTTSMTNALEMMGYTCTPSTETTLASCGFNEGILSFLEWLQTPARIVRAVRTSPEWSKIVETAKSATAFGDGPYLFLYKEMDKMFPGSSSSSPSKGRR